LRESRFDVWRRQLNAQHGPCAINELALEHGEIERTFYGFGRCGGAERTLCRSQRGQRQSVRP
jgi:hypothetical protein